MQLPFVLQQALEELIPAQSLHTLQVSRKELTHRYRHEPQNKPCMTTLEHKYSYLYTRLPATYAAIRQMLQQNQESLAFFSVKSCLDLGTGPGTAMWAIHSHFANIEKITMIERDLSLIDIGKQLASKSSFSALQTATWLHSDLLHIDYVTHDVVFLSYVIGEFQEAARHTLIQKAWQATNDLLFIIEPGTPIGFSHLLKARDWLLQAGGYLLAPCPHHQTCPLAKNDWCHFAVRVERSAMHRQLKEAQLGHEDEKFSYLIVSKQPITQNSARILLQPLKRSGHSEFALCTSNKGLQKTIISKRHKENYVKARKLEWGDLFNIFN